jgi:hypothetical protein
LVIIGLSVIKRKDEQMRKEFVSGETVKVAYREGTFRVIQKEGPYAYSLHCLEENQDYLVNTEYILPLDQTDSPSHYTGHGGIQPIDFIMSNKLGFCEGNIVKYVYRWQGKGGVEDLKKAEQYIKFLIAEAEGKDIHSNE